MKTKLKMVRCAFLDLYVPVPFKGEGKNRYNATFLIERGSENDKAIQAGILATATEAWPKNFAAMLESFKGNSNKYCYLNGDTKDYDGYAGMNYLATHRQQKDGPPMILGPNIDPALGLDDKGRPQLERLKEASGKPYAGCYVNATVEMWAQMKDYPGLRCTVLGIQFAADGDAFSAVSRGSQDDFDSIDEGADADSLV